MVCHYCFFNHGFKFQNSVVMVAIITLKGVDYRDIIHDVSKSEAIRLLKICLHDDNGYI